MSETPNATDQIPDASKVADKPAAKTTAKKAPARKAPVKKAPVKSTAAKAAEKETHIADKIKTLPRRRVWPD